MVFAGIRNLISPVTGDRQLGICRLLAVAAAAAISFVLQAQIVSLVQKQGFTVLILVPYLALAAGESLGRVWAESKVIDSNVRIRSVGEPEEE